MVQIPFSTSSDPYFSDCVSVNIGATRIINSQYLVHWIPPHPNKKALYAVRQYTLYTQPWRQTMSSIHDRPPTLSFGYLANNSKARKKVEGTRMLSPIIL